MYFIDFSSTNDPTRLAELVRTGSFDKGRAEEQSSDALASDPLPFLFTPRRQLLLLIQVLSMATILTAVPAASL